MLKHFKKNEKVLVQFITYGFVGGLAFVIDFAALWFFTDVMGIHYLYSAVIGFVLGLMVNYLLSICWVFNARKLKNVHAEFMIFTVIGLIGLGINELILWFFTDIKGVYYLYSKIIATAVVFIWNFVARKKILF